MLAIAMDDPIVVNSVIGLSAFLIGLSKGGLGGMMGALITALMALVMPAEVAIGMLLPMLIVGDVFAVTAHWRRWDSRIVRLLIPGAALGTLVATLFITSISTDTLRLVLGVLILIFVIYRLLERRILRSLKYSSRGWHGLIAGTVAGLTSTLAHVGGPPITIYLLMQNLRPRTLVATSALFFSILNLIKLPGYLYADLIMPSMLRQLLWTIPLIVLGIWVGRVSVDRVDKRIFDGIMTLLLAISGLMLIAG
jgi:uncharacterized membrane protein YfcA